MLTVACVLKVNLTQDDRFKTVYLPRHVRRLQEMVSTHLKQPHRFVTLTNLAPENMPQFDTMPIGHDWPGWWSKISLFEPGRFDGRVLYLDLDVTVVGPLDDLADFDVPFIAVPDYQYPLQINSSVMAWDVEFAHHVYEEFAPQAEKVMAELRGDQDWINKHIFATRYPKRWVPSYKVHVLPNGGRVPDDARVIVYHGQPKPWDLPADHLDPRSAA